MLDWVQIILAAAPPDQKPGLNTQYMITFLIMMFIAFYFLMIRPQRREQQQKQSMLSQIEKGDKVVTIGGIHGVVSGVDPTKEIVTIEVAKNVKIDFSRRAIHKIEPRNKKTAEESRG